MKRMTGVVAAMTISALLVSFAWLLLTEQRISAEEFFACNIAAFDDSCNIGCPDGYANDDNGCPVCECRSVPAVADAEQRCETLTCSKRCENYVVDAKGCATCECAEIAVMPMALTAASACNITTFRESCDIGCPGGYAHDDNGCPLCECIRVAAGSDIRVETCETLTCRNRCEDYVVDEKGCATCECAEIAAMPMMKTGCDIAAFEASCETGCPDGYANDDNGCPVCECRSVPVAAAEQRCETLTCSKRCEDYLVDDNGCSTCECAPWR